jgi:lysophospholipase L1-like esterase
VIALASAIVACEAGFRMLDIARGPEAHRFFIWPPHMTRAFHAPPGVLPGVQGPTRFTTDEYGFRATIVDQTKPLYRVLVLGGSATECLYLDDAKAWPIILERELSSTSGGRRVWVANAGRSGMNSRDHVVQLTALLKQSPRFDLVLVMAGVNDLSVALAGVSREGDPPLDAPDAAVVHALRAFSLSPERPAGDVDRIRVVSLLRRVKHRLESAGVAQAEDGSTYEKWRQFRHRARRQLADPGDLSPHLAEYRDTLHRLVRTASKAGTTLVLVTQPALWRGDLPPASARLLWLGGRGRFQIEQVSEYYSAAALARGLAAFNEVMLDVCEKERIRCIDVAATVSGDIEAFYDDSHFTDKGAAVTARTIAVALRESAPFIGAAQ